MSRILLALTGLVIYLVVMVIVSYYVSGKKKTDKLGLRVSETQETLRALPDRQRKRVEKSLLILEAHPDLRNGLGALVSARYAQQIRTMAERYAKTAGGNAGKNQEQNLEGVSMTNILASDPGMKKGQDEATLLLKEGISTIEGKIAKALEAKGAKARDELDIYVRFLREVD